MTGKFRSCVALMLVAGLVWPAGTAWAQAQGKYPNPPYSEVELERQSLERQSRVPDPKRLEKDRQDLLSRIKPPLESLSEECRARCGALYQAAVDAVERYIRAFRELLDAKLEDYDAEIATFNARPHLKAAKERLEGLRRTLLTLQDRDQRAAVLKEISRLEPEVEARRKELERLEAEESKAIARLQRAFREYDSTQSGLEETRDAYADCVKGCREEGGGGMSTGVKVVLGTAILGGVGVGVSQLSKGGDSPGDGGGGTGGGSPPRNGTVTLTTPFGVEVYRGQGPAGVDATYSGFLPRVAENCPDSVTFPSGLNLSAAASGFGTGGGTGTFSANVTGQLFNAQLNLNFQGAQATTRYVITVPIPGQAPCDIILEGQLPRQGQ